MILGNTILITGKPSSRDEINNSSFFLVFILSTACKCRQRYQIRQNGSWDNGAWIQFPPPPALTNYSESDESFSVFPDPPVQTDV